MKFFRIKVVKIAGLSRYQYFDGGGQKSVSRNNENRIRPIRSF